MTMSNMSTKWYYHNDNDDANGAALCAHRHPPPAAGAEEKLSRISFRQSTLIDKCPTEAATEDTDPYRSPLSLG